MVATVFGLALILRLAVAIRSPVWMHDDGVGYDQVARSIVRGEGFVRDGRPTAAEDPLYPIFLAVVYRVAGTHLLSVRSVQSVLNAAACSVVAALGVWMGGPAVGWLSGLFAACYPSLVRLSCHWLSEALFIPLLVFALAAWVLWQRRPRLRWALLTGGLFGLAALTRSSVALLPLLLAWLAWRRAMEWKTVAVHWHVGLMLIAMVLTVAPWTIRNWLAFHEVIPISTKTGLDLYASYFPPEGKLFGLTPVDENMAAARAMTSETHASAFLIAKTWEFIVHQPKEALRLLLLKALFLVTPFDWEILGYRVYNVGYSLMVPWAVAGLWLSQRRRLAVEPLTALVAYYLVLMLATYGSPRLRLPVEPVLLVFAALACVVWFQQVGRWSVGLATVAAWCAIHLAIWWNSEALYLLCRRAVVHARLW